MSKHYIKNVPRYYEPYVCDCFHNAISAQLLYMGLNPKIVLADYLCFMHDPQTGYIGINYLYKYNTTVEFTEEELNTSFEFAYFAPPKQFEVMGKSNQVTNDRIIVNMYLNNDSEKADKHLKTLIDNDIPTSVAVDLYYMRYHRAYQKDHGLHYVVITGYDEDTKCYELFDKYKLSSSDFDGVLPMQDILLARESDNPQKNDLVGEYTRPLQNIWCEISSSPNFIISEEKVYGIIKESCTRMRGDKTVLGNKCGIDAIKMLISDIQTNNRESMFKTYYNETFKTIARNRKRFKVFLEQFDTLAIPAVISILEESAKSWDICANLALKFGLTKKPQVITDIISQLNNIIDKETILVENLESVTGLMKVR